MANNDSLVTFQPPVGKKPQPARFIVSAPVGPAPITDLNWLTNWTPPVPKRPRVERPHFSLVISDPASFTLAPFVENVSRPASLTRHVFNYQTAQSLVGVAPQPVNFIPSVAPAHVCEDTLAELQVRVAEMLDDGTFTYYTENEIRHALNRAERLFVYLTLCYEKTASFTLTNGQAFYDISDQISDFLVPLRVSHSGTRLRPDTIHTLDMRDSTWRARAGNPQRYVQQGFNLLAITPQPASGVHTLDFTYAAEPPPMVNGSDAPTIPAEQQVHLPDGAYYFLRMKEGSAELQMAIGYLQRFVEAAQKYRGFTLARSKAQSYDRQPVDLERFDRGSLEIKLTRQRQIAKKQKEETGQ